MWHFGSFLLFDHIVHKLFDHIVHKLKLREDEARRFFQQIVSGVE